MHFDDLFRDGEPETGATFFLRAGGTLSLAELFKDLVLIGLGNARPGIGNGNLERAVCCCHLDPNLAGVRELDRVADKVQQHLRNSPFVSRRRRQVARAR